MTRRTAWSTWLALPEVARVAAVIVLLVIVGLLAGCSHLSQPRLSGDVVRKDALLCEIHNDRLCIGELWLRIKFALEL